MKSALKRLLDCANEITALTDSSAKMLVTEADYQKIYDRHYPPEKPEELIELEVGTEFQYVGLKYRIVELKRQVGLDELRFTAYYVDTISTELGIADVEDQTR